MTGIDSSELFLYHLGLQKLFVSVCLADDTGSIVWGYRDLAGVFGVGRDVPGGDMAALSQVEKNKIEIGFGNSGKEGIDLPACRSFLY